MNSGKQEELAKLLDIATEIAKKAGELLLNRPDTLTTETKTSAIDLVTQMDKASEKLIVSEIKKARPDDGIIGEEGAEHLSKTGYTWHIDPIDGTGPSGYELLPWRMQMLGMQYSWYAAGFIEFMLRGADGKFVFLHRFRNSNVNTEAYMRTANMPVRYEVENRSAVNKLSADITCRMLVFLLRKLEVLR